MIGRGILAALFLACAYLLGDTWGFERGRETAPEYVAWKREVELKDDAFHREFMAMEQQIADRCGAVKEYLDLGEHPPVPYDY